MSAITCVGNRTGSNGIKLDHYEESPTARQVVRERVKFEMVGALRAIGRPASPTEIASAIGSSSLLVGRIATEAPRTFVIDRVGSVKSYRGKTTKIQIRLHPHLA